MANNIVLEAVITAKQYLSNKFEQKDLATIMVEIEKISGIKNWADLKTKDERIGYTDLQKKLANLNEKVTNRKEKGVYYTPSDVVKFIVTNSIKSAYGKLHPNSLHVMDLNGIPYKSFCLTKRVYDPTCGAGEFLLAALEIKFDLMDMHKQSIGKTTVHSIVKTIYGNDTFDSPKGGAQNKVVYGTPGCGKSYYVQNTVLPKLGVVDGDRIRTTFYQDYTNIDFVGQILPKVHDDQSVTYDFNPGPFALALKKAIKYPEKPIALIIEELNRGNAASIFGDIFQLLDRDKTGKSQYSITNVNLQDYLNKCFSDEGYIFNEIYIPSNLHIIATMNTSDQNVFTLDTAFKRRWQFEKLRNKFSEDHEYKGYFLPGMPDVTWQKLVDDINTFIVNSANELSYEDKQLGVYFIDKETLCEKTEDCSDEHKINKFAYKLFEYLWDDVAKFARPDWFGAEIKSLDDLIDAYLTKGKKVFVDGIIKEQSQD